MTTLSKSTKDKHPPKTLVLQPSAFADSYAQKPSVDVAVGLRFISQGEIDTARQEAERIARRFYEDFASRDLEVSREPLEDAYNDAFLALVIAAATCDPNDLTRPYFEFAEDTVRRALTPEALRRLWDDVVILHKGSVEARHEATDEEIQVLAQSLPRAELDSESRRLCAYLMEKLKDAGQLVEEPEDKPQEDAEAVYTARVS